MTENLSNTPESIIKRLEKLRIWQEEQQQLLFRRQTSQRELLNMEQENMYKHLGLSPPAKLKDSPNNQCLKNVANAYDDNSYLDTSSNLNKKSDINKTTGAGHHNSRNNSNNDQHLFIKPKKFLKRGEGLKNRFKMDPDAFRLDNLPKYKYANLKRSCHQNKKPSLPEENTNKKESKQSLKNHRLEYVPKNQLNLENNKSNRKMLNSEEENQQSSHSHNSSDSRRRSFESMEQKTFETPKISWATVLDPNNIEPISVKDLHNNNSTSLSSTKDHFEDTTDNLSIFELLEQKAQDSNFSLNASNIKKWIQEKAMKLVNETEEALANDNALKKIGKDNNLRPFPFEVNSKLIPDEDDDEWENESSLCSAEEECTTSNDDDDGNTSGNDQKKNNRQQQQVRFSENVLVNNETDVSETETVDSIEMTTANNANTSTPCDKSDFERFKMRLFGGAGKSETTNNDDDNNNESTLIESSSSIQCANFDDDVHNQYSSKKKIAEQSELLKIRLHDLENEIDSFKKNNSELIKLKQEHELKKIELEQERLEMNEKLNDEKIKLEIYLHDERMKIEDDKKKLDKLIKDQRIPNRKERDEIIKLKEQVENLQKDNKAKETKHVSAQSRLRAQIRNLEKELKDLSFEFEHLKKENKKLESENTKLNRQSNNKMLQEINKTIAKLTPKPVEVTTPPVVTEVRNRNMKSATATVTSHKKPLEYKKSTTKTKRMNRIINEDTANSSEEEDDISLGSTSSEEDDISFKRKENFKKSSERLNKQNCEINKHVVSNSSSSSRDFKREIQNSDGSKDIWYPNGNLKKISSDGMYIRMLYFNKDIKETNISEGTVKYYYAETNTWHTTYLDGLEIFEFPNGQTEHRYKDGTIEIHFANGSIRITNPLDENKAEEWRYSDGTNLIQLKNGDKILSLPNGQKEIHTKIHKRREYPDGTVKIVYPDGSQETRYSNGRVRLKDKDGILIMDSENIKY